MKCSYCGSDKDVIKCPALSRPTFYCYNCCRNALVLVCKGKNVCERYKKIYEEIERLKENKREEAGDILDKAILDLKDILEREKRLLKKVQEDDSLPTYIAKMLENIVIDIEDLIEDLSIANDDEIRELINRIGEKELKGEGV